MEAEVGHHGHRHPALQLAPILQVPRDQGDQVVAVVEPPGAIDREHPVAVAVVGEADVGAGRLDQLDQGLRVRRAATGVDVAPVRLDRDQLELGAKAPKITGAAR